MIFAELQIWDSIESGKDELIEIENPSLPKIGLLIHRMRYENAALLAVKITDHISIHLNASKESFWLNANFQQNNYGKDWCYVGYKESFDDETKYILGGQPIPTKNRFLHKWNDVIPEFLFAIEYPFSTQSNPDWEQYPR